MNHESEYYREVIIDLLKTTENVGVLKLIYELLIRLK